MRKTTLKLLSTKRLHNYFRPVKVGELKDFLFYYVEHGQGFAREIPFKWMMSEFHFHIFSFVYNPMVKVVDRLRYSTL